jgi:hypothetical protein
MTRTLADAIGANAAIAVAADTDLIAYYVTGAGIAWTPAQIALIPAGKTVVTIDQGGDGSPVIDAIVRDYEPGAWYSADVVTEAWTAIRPTIYCDQSDLTQVLSYGWTGDLWLAIIGWKTGDPLPDVGACNVAAVQTQQNVAGSIDLSTVIDDTWPGGQRMSAFMVQDATSGAIYLIDGGKSHHVTTPAAVQAYQGIGIPLVASVADDEVQALITDFPPGAVAAAEFPSFTVTPVASS